MPEKTKKTNYSRGTSSISVAMPADLLDRLNEHAEASGFSRNRIIIMAIEKKLEEGEMK